MWYLENINLFDIICPHRFKEFKQTHTFKEYKKGEFIYLHHDQSTRLYLIAKGKVKLMQYTNEGDEVLKAILSRGEVFGEMALIGRGKTQRSSLGCRYRKLMPHKY
jgi:CRP-like cAMP-binding protein